MALTGLETLQVLGQNPSGVPAASTFQTTTGAIAALAATESSPFIVTPITTVGNGTLTAAGLIGGEILRTGPVANFSDTTATAAQIIAALPGLVVSSTFNILIKNSTAFTQTILAGVGVTLPLTVITPAFSVNNYIATINSSSAITLVHIDTTAISTGTYYTAPNITTLSTIGAGTILATNFVGGYTARAGSQSASPFTDTTDTAAAIIAANASLVNKIGTAVPYFYANTTNALATLTGGTGVTVSGVTTVPAGMVAYYLITYTAAATLTMVGIGLTNNISTAMALAGSSSGETILQPAAAASGTLTLPAATDTLVGKATTDTLTNKTLVDSSTSIVDDGDATKVLNWQLSGMTTGKTATISATNANNATYTLPPSTGVLAATSGANLFVADLKRCTAQVDQTGTTLANVTGLSFTVVPGVYSFYGAIDTTCGGTGGVKLAFNYTTTVVSVINANAFSYTASAIAVSKTTTTTTQTSIVASNTAFTNVILTGTMTVTTGGTVDLQFAENSANSTSSVLVGSTLQLTRIS